MSDIDRKRAIEILKSERDNDIFSGCGGRKHIHEALSIAIASLETDEAYQLEYESTTKNDLVVKDKLTDTEQRIFLSAISREEKVCREIDNDKVYDGTCQMLLPIVKSIKRKVKKVLF